MYGYKGPHAIKHARQNQYFPTISFSMLSQVLSFSTTMNIFLTPKGSVSFILAVASRRT